MERLTIDTKILFCDISQCRETPGGSFCEDGYCDQRRCYERLREYERKGLAPEDAPSWTERAEVHSAIRLLKQYEALGTIADLTDLAKARDEGRVVALPCKVGYTVYEPICDHVEAWPVESFEIGSDMVARPCYYNYGEIISCGFEDGAIFQVFLTRAEAEAALKGAVDHEAD